MAVYSLPANVTVVTDAQLMFAGKLFHVVTHNILQELLPLLLAAPCQERSRCQ